MYPLNIRVATSDDKCWPFTLAFLQSSHKGVFHEARRSDYWGYRTVPIQRVFCQDDVILSSSGTDRIPTDPCYVIVPSLRLNEGSSVLYRRA
jgi:hypothetical protein